MAFGLRPLARVAWGAQQSPRSGQRFMRRRGRRSSYREGGARNEGGLCVRDSMGPEIPDVRGRTLGGPDNLTPLTPSSKTAETSWGSSTLSAEAACKFRSGSTGIQHPQPSETGGKRGRDDSFDSQQGSGDFDSTALQQGMSHGGASETALPRKGRCGVITSAARARPCHKTWAKGAISCVSQNDYGLVSVPSPTIICFARGTQTRSDLLN